MAQDLHTVTMIDGAGNQNRSDRLLAGLWTALAYAAGAGAGASVAIPVAMKNLPAKYAVLVTPDQDAVASVAKTATGFTVTLSPRLAANTLAAGSLDVLLVA